MDMESCSQADINADKNGLEKDCDKSYRNSNSPSESDVKVLESETKQSIVLLSNEDKENVKNENQDPEFKKRLEGLFPFLLLLIL